MIRITRIRPRGLRRRLSGVVAIVRLLALVQRARWSDQQIGLSLMYHRVGPVQGHRSVDLVPTLHTDTFARHMTIVRRAFSPVPASSLLPAIQRRRRGQRIPLAVTFDDDLSSHLQHAAPVLMRRRIPATFFVCGADGRRFWWELLQAAVDHDLIESALSHPDVPTPVCAAWRGSPTDIHLVAAAMTELDAETRSTVTARLRRVLDAAGVSLEASLTADQLRQMAGSFELGFHTREHDFLPALGAAALDRALHDGRDELRALTGQSLATFAYPHGAYSATVARATASAGFTAAFTTESHAISSHDDPMRLGRLECLGPVGDLARMLSAEILGRAAVRGWRRQPASARRSAA